MLLKNDPKKMAALILVRKGEPKSYSDMKKDNGEMNQNLMEDSEPDMDDGVVAAAEDMMKAIQAKDAKALAKAFHEAFEMCGSYSAEKE